MPPSQTPTLYLVCGKIASGKSTLAEKLAHEHGAILLNQDDLNARLWPGEIKSLDDYRERWKRLCSAIGPLVRDILGSGISVVLDFPGNTKRQREWMAEILRDSGAKNELHYLDISDAVCKARLAARNAAGEHPFSPSEDDFDLVTSFFDPPTGNEGLTIIVHRE